MMRLVLAFVMVILCATLNLAYQLPATDRSGPRTGSISGSVVAERDGNAIAGATVLLRDKAMSVVGRAETDGFGRFTFPNLSAGTFHVLASRAGFATTEFGEGLLSSGVPIDLSSGQLVSNLRVTLPRSSSLSGRVSDPGGEPIEGATVAAVRVPASTGTDDYQILGSAVTDDRGEFRIFGLRSDRYLLVCSRVQDGAVSKDARAIVDWGGISQLRIPVSPRVPIGGLPSSVVFYPSASAPDEASVVDLQTGDDRTGLDIVIAKKPAARVFGLIRISPSDAPPSRINVIAFPHRGGFARSLFLPPAVPAVLQGRSYRVEGLPVGQYTILARGETARAEPAASGRLANSFALATVTVGADTISMVDLTLEPGTTVSATVADAARSWSDVQFRLSPLGELPDFEFPPARANSEGQFSWVGVPQGRYCIQAISARAGEVKSWPIVVTTEAGGIARTFLATQSGLHLKVQPTAPEGSVEGEMVDTAGRAYWDAVVQLAPVDAELQEVLGNRQLRPSYSGAFQFSGLPPGQYAISVISAQKVQIVSRVISVPQHEPVRVRMVVEPPRNTRITRRIDG